MGRVDHRPFRAFADTARAVVWEQALLAALPLAHPRITLAREGCGHVGVERLAGQVDRPARLSFRAHVDLFGQLASSVRVARVACVARVAGRSPVAAALGAQTLAAQPRGAHRSVPGVLALVVPAERAPRADGLRLRLHRRGRAVTILRLDIHLREDGAAAALLRDDELDAGVRDGRGDLGLLLAEPEGRDRLLVVDRSVGAEVDRDRHLRLGGDVCNDGELETPGRLVDPLRDRRARARRVELEQLDSEVLLVPGGRLADLARLELPRAELIAAPRVEVRIGDDARAAARCEEGARHRYEEEHDDAKRFEHGGPQCPSCTRRPSCPVGPPAL
jgi:hypothetical protein